MHFHITLKKDLMWIWAQRKEVVLENPIRVFNWFIIRIFIYFALRFVPVQYKYLV